ncbi:MAG: hypothetical protein IPK26_26340 [Planctomycetes bacterium]|nr:hypothetical protein [Planctomycetota bacterium]
MAVTYALTVYRDLGMKAGVGRTVVADVTVTGTPVAIADGGNPLTLANLHTLNMRRVDRINFDGQFLDTTSSPVLLTPAIWHPATGGFVWAETGTDGAPSEQEVNAFANAATAFRVEFVGA